MMALPLDEFIEQALKRNKVSQAHKEVLSRGIEMVKRCHAEGIYILFTDGLRTFTDQAILFGKGRRSDSNPKSKDYTFYNGKDYANPSVKKVTNAKPGNSFHNYGLALDFVLTDADAKKVFWSRNKQWERAAAIAKELGFDWGGDWKGFVDNPHIQYDGGLSLAQIKAGKMPKFKSYKPIGKVEEELKFTSASLKNKVNSILTDKKMQEKLITDGIKIEAFSSTWKEKYVSNDIAEGDWIGLNMLYLEKKGGK